MVLISMLITLAIVGFILWLVVTYVPMPPPFKQAVIVFAILACIVWLLRVAYSTGMIPFLR